MKIKGDIKVAISKAQTEIENVYSDITSYYYENITNKIEYNIKYTFSKAVLAITNPSSPLPTIAHPIIHPSPFVANTPVNNFPNTAGIVYNKPPPIDFHVRVSLIGITNPKELKNIRLNHSFVYFFLSNSFSNPSTSEKLIPATKAPNRNVDPLYPTAMDRHAPNTTRYISLVVLYLHNIKFYSKLLYYNNKFTF